MGDNRKTLTRAEADKLRNEGIDPEFVTLNSNNPFGNKNQLGHTPVKTSDKRDSLLHLENIFTDTIEAAPTAKSILEMANDNEVPRAQGKCQISIKDALKIVSDYSGNKDELQTFFLDIEDAYAILGKENE